MKNVAPTAGTYLQKPILKLAKQDVAGNVPVTTMQQMYAGIALRRATIDF